MVCSIRHSVSLGGRALPPPKNCSYSILSLRISCSIRLKSSSVSFPVMAAFADAVFLVAMGSAGNGDLWFAALGFGRGHDGFDFRDGARQARGQQLVSRLSDENVVFDAHAEIFLGEIKPGLDGDDHTCFEPAVWVAGV